MPYRICELINPRASLLESACVLLAVPGNPPSPDHLRHVETLIDEQDWLSDWFVLLFVPGCTPNIRRRFQMRYDRQGLVIIDDASIVDMVLAEAEQKNPLGHLRSLMLNAKDAAKGTDIFKINQLVKSRTAIFEGRKNLVDRILSTTNNYALYGGRRIGKSSILAEIEDRLRQRSNVNVVVQSFEGMKECSDDATARILARALRLQQEVNKLEDFRFAIQAHLEQHPEERIVILLDELDKYIVSNPNRHLLIEMLRALSERFPDRFRTIVAGFMELYDCIQGRGPYTSTSDPWQRMSDDIGPVPNLPANQGEMIVVEGFRNILGWRFESRLIPQLVVEKTGGHPAFVQYFCMKLQQRVAQRGDQLIRKTDVDAIFNDEDPEHSFIAYVKKTLEMNLDPVGRFLILLIAGDAKESRRFTLGQVQEYAQYSQVTLSSQQIQRSLERLTVTSVVRESKPEVYEFTVPDYPLILSRLGETGHLDEIEQQISQLLEQGHAVD